MNWLSWASAHSVPPHLASLCIPFPQNWKGSTGMACPFTEVGKRSAEQSSPIPWVLSRASGAFWECYVWCPPLPALSSPGWLLRHLPSKVPEQSCVGSWLWRNVERASCAGIGGLRVRGVQSRQVSLPSRAFTVYTMGRTTSRTGFDFIDANSFGKGRVRDAYTCPLPFKPY